MKNINRKKGFNKRGSKQNKNNKKGFELERNKKCKDLCKKREKDRSKFWKKKENSWLSKWNEIKNYGSAQFLSLFY